MMSEDADVTPHCSTKQVIIGQRVSVIPSGDWLCALSVTAQRLDIWSQCVPPTFVSQCCWSVFLETHMFHSYIHTFASITSGGSAQEQTHGPFASGRQHPCVSDWVYEPYQQWRMCTLHPWIRAENLSVICLCFSQIHAQIHVSCRRPQNVLKPQSNPDYNSWISYSIKTQQSCDCFGHVVSR